jgi:hypothetical protein
MRIAMSGPDVEVFVEKLKAGGDIEALEAASGVDPAWFEANRESLLRLAGFDAPEGDESDGTPKDPPPEGAAPKKARAPRKPKTPPAQ